jgi:hypothetical protein
VILAATSLLLVAALGIPLASALHPRLTGSALFGTGFLTGLGAGTLFLFLASVTSIPWTRLFVFAPLLLISLAAWAIVRPEGRLLGDRRPLGGSAAKLATATVVVLYGWYAVRSAGWDWSVWIPTQRDFYYIWGLKGRDFFEARGVDWDFLRRSPSDLGHSDYPLLVPLAFDLIAVARGGWSERELGLLYAAVAAALVLLAHGLFRRQTSSASLASLGALALAGVAIMPNVGLADTPLVVFATAAVAFIRRHVRLGDAGDLRIGAVLLGLAAWTKNEGEALIAAAAVALLIATGSWRTMARLWPAAAIAAPWLLARAALSLPTDHFSGHAPRVLDVLSRLSGIFATMPNVPIAKPLFALAVAAALLTAGPRRLADEGFTVITVALLFASYLAVYVISPHELREHVTGTWGRLQFHLLGPLALIAIDSVIARISPAPPDPEAASRAPS